MRGERSMKRKKSCAMLEVRELSKSFGGLKAVDQASLDVRQGEIVGLIGPNGAGKTTLFAAIAGFHTPDAGKVTFEGNDITGLAPHRICAAGMVRTFQITQPFAKISVRENIMVGAFFHTANRGTAEREAEAVAATVGMASQLDQMGADLTVAGRKRLELARALATSPRLLLLDEPAAGMNPAETHEVTELISRLRDERGVSILVIEHDMHVVGSCSDRVVALDHGVKIAEGGFDQVATHPAVVEAYLGKDPEALSDAG